jgi:hypothetical protein
MEGPKLKCEVNWRNFPNTSTCHGLDSLRRTLSKDPIPTTTPAGMRQSYETEPEEILKKGGHLAPP